MYDLIIIGGGPAGLTAGLYSARARLNVLMLEKLAPGGQVAHTIIGAQPKSSIEAELKKLL